MQFVLIFFSWCLIRSILSLIVNYRYAKFVTKRTFSQTHHHLYISFSSWLSRAWRCSLDGQGVFGRINLAQLEVTMAHNVHQPVDLHGPPAHVTRHPQCAQARGRPLCGGVGREGHALGQQVRPPGTKAQPPLLLGAQVAQQHGGILVRVQREETCVGEAGLHHLGQRPPAVRTFLHSQGRHSLTHQS